MTDADILDLVRFLGACDMAFLYFALIVCPMLYVFYTLIFPETNGDKIMATVEQAPITAITPMNGDAL